MDEKLKMYKKYRDSIVSLMVISGLWPTYEKHPHYLQRFLLGATAISGAMSSLGIISFCVVNFSSVATLTKGLGVMLSFSSIVVKVSYVFVHF